MVTSLFQVYLHDMNTNVSYVWLQDFSMDLAIDLTTGMIDLSNNRNKSANPIITNVLQKLFESYGYRVSINNPFEGGFITKHYGKPMNHINVIQIEINKKLYLFEENFNIDMKYFNKLKNCFSDIINYINSKTKKFEM